MLQIAKCEDCGKECQLLEVAGMTLCPECIAPPPDAPRIVFFIDYKKEEVCSVVVPGNAIDKNGNLRKDNLS